MRNTSGLKRTAGPGRPKGSKTRTRLAFEAFWREKLESEEYRAGLWRRINGGRASHMESYLANKLFGSPTQKVELSGTVDVIARLEAARARVGDASPTRPR